MAEENRFLRGSSQEHYTLLIGEGNFSFAAELIKETKNKVIATCLKLKTEAPSKTQLDNMDTIQNHGGIVYTDVDATCIDSHPEIQKYIFDIIIFNFPHIAGKMKIGENRNLLQQFFLSAKKVLAPEGEIQVTLCKGQSGTLADRPQRKWSDSWQIVALAAGSDLILKDVKPFAKYPGYTCSGYRGNEKSFNIDGAMTFIFRHGGSLKEVIFQKELHLVESEKLLAKQLHLCIEEELRKFDAIMIDRYHPFNKIISSISAEVKEKCCAELDDFSHMLFCNHEEHPILCEPNSLASILPKCCKVTALKSFADHVVPKLKSNSNLDIFVTTALCCPCFVSQDILSFFKPYVSLFSNNYSEIVSMVKFLLHSVFHNIETDTNVELCEQLLNGLTYGTNDHKLISMFVKKPTLSLCEFLKWYVELNNKTSGPEKHPKFENDILNIVVTYSPTVIDGYLFYSDIQFSLSNTPNSIVDNNKESLKIGSFYRIFYDNVTYICAMLDVACMSQIKYNVFDYRTLFNEHAYYVTLNDDTSKNLYRPFALYPPSYIHDVSFWVSEQFSEIKLMILIKNMLPNVISRISLIDTYYDKYANRMSMCYRFVYCSIDNPLSKEKARDINVNFLREMLKSVLDVELR